MRLTGRHRLRRGLCLLLSLLALASAGPSVRAETGENGALPAVEGVLDKEELDGLLADFMEEHHLSADRFSLGYVYLDTGESYFFNGEAYYDSASLYKLPLMMMIENDIYTGKLELENDRLYGMDREEAEYLILVKSQNMVAERLYEHFGGFQEFRKAEAEIADMSLQELPKDYLRTREVSAPYMIHILQKLYDEPESYPRVLENLLKAQPDQYFRHFVEDYEIAQKYGSYEGYNHTAGILYMPHPILLCVMSYWPPTPELTIGRVAEFMVDYTLKLDERLEKQQKAAEEAALAEEKRRAAEEAARATEPPQASAAPETAPADRTPEPAADRAPEAAPAEMALGRGKLLALLSLAAGVLTLAALLSRGRRSGKKRKRRKHRR